MKQIGFNLTSQSWCYVFVSHVSVHHTDSVLNLKLFTVKLLNDSPNLIQTVRVNQTTDKLNRNSIRNLIFILWSDITVPDWYHCSWRPIDRVSILNTPFAFSDWFAVEFQWSCPATCFATLIDSALFAKVFRNIEKSTSNYVAQHEYFN